MSCWFFLDFICIDWCWVYLEEVCICFITYQDLLIYFVVIVVLLFIYLFLSMLVGLWELNSPSGYCIQCPLQWKLGVLTTGQPGKHIHSFINPKENPTTELSRVLPEMLSPPPGCFWKCMQETQRHHLALGRWFPRPPTPWVQLQHWWLAPSTSHDLLWPLSQEPGAQFSACPPIHPLMPSRNQATRRVQKFIFLLVPSQLLNFPPAPPSLTFSLLILKG